MRVVQEPGYKPIKIWTDDIDETALSQLKNIARLPFIHSHGVVAMPDVHYGIGATVGSVIATKGAIIPAAVGVDIGCGMCAVRLTLKAADLPDNLKAIRYAIERDTLSEHTQDKRHQLTLDLHGEQFDVLANILARQSFTKNKNKLIQKAITQLGTLGSGNHFIELCVDESQDVWVMLHSGSRGIGNILGNYFITLAKENMEHYFSSLPDKNLAYFTENTQHYFEYIEAVQWAQQYAFKNRQSMMEDVLSILSHFIEKPFKVTEEAINCHHNYVEQEKHFGTDVWLTRKGAIRAREDDLGIIPGSMGQKSYIVKGKNNPNSYHSCSHGAGRRMGRNAAKQKFSVQDLEAQTLGVECRKDAAVLDEIPSCYKDIDTVMSHQQDLVEVLHILKQVLCVKGS